MSGPVKNKMLEKVRFVALLKRGQNVGYNSKKRIDTVGNIWLVVPNDEFDWSFLFRHFAVRRRRRPS